MSNLLMPLLIALQFLTIFPIRLPRLPTAAEQGKSLLFYPLVGALIGALLSMALWLLPTTSPLVSAAILLILWIVFTGGLHLDGLADSADAWLGGIGDKARTLAIMKDPAAGPIAVVTLVSLLLLKFALLYTVVIQQLWPALIWACLLSRLAMPLLFLTTPYVREQGLGSIMQHYLPATAIRWLSALMSCIILFVLGVCPLLIGLSIFLSLRYLMEKRLGGFTGDTAGALLELLEVTILLTVVS